MAGLEGTTLKDQYFLRKKVGSGGSADVYQAWDKKRSTPMAVKVMRQDLANDARLIKMFEKEAALLRQLSHPNIVRLYEFDKQDNIVYFIMDWVEGSDLKQAILKNQKPFTLESVIHILEPISVALDFAHKEMVFHCDVKPANILLHEDGRVLLTDFGVARRVYEQKQGGTPPYMAPEQFTGGQIDARTDVYGLAVVIYELLSGGNVPFRGDSPLSQSKTTPRDRIEWEHLNLPLAPIHQYNPTLPDEVEAVVGKALNKDPNLRYPSVVTLREEFEDACRKGKPVDRSGDTILGILPPPIPKPPASPHPIPPKDNQLEKIHGPHLFGRSGEFAGRVILLSLPSVSLGRGKGNQLCLQEKSVSRTHATVVKTRRGVYIRDEQSSLGTFLNGKRIPAGVPVPLRDGDVIRVGYGQELEFKEK
jgi:serine/threonine protein kinase